MHGRMTRTSSPIADSESPSCSPLQKTLLWLDMARTSSEQCFLSRTLFEDERTRSTRGWAGEVDPKPTARRGRRNSVQPGALAPIGPLL